MSLEDALSKAQTIGSHGRKDVQHEDGAQVSVYSDVNRYIYMVPGQSLKEGTIEQVKYYLQLQHVSKDTGWSPVQRVKQQ